MQCCIVTAVLFSFIGNIAFFVLLSVNYRTSYWFVCTMLVVFLQESISWTVAAGSFLRNAQVDQKEYSTLVITYVVKTKFDNCIKPKSNTKGHPW